jgi:hypothetical protein
MGDGFEVCCLEKGHVRVNSASQSSKTNHEVMAFPAVNLGRLGAASRAATTLLEAPAAGSVPHGARMNWDLALDAFCSAALAHDNRSQQEPSSRAATAQRHF